MLKPPVYSSRLSDGKFNRSCPLSIKNAPVIDYKNVSLLKKYMSENNKILSSKITSVSSGKQKKLTKEMTRTECSHMKLDNNLSPIKRTIVEKENMLVKKEDSNKAHQSFRPQFPRKQQLE